MRNLSINYDVERPLAVFDEKNLRDLITQQTLTKTPDIEICTLVIREFRKRNLLMDKVDLIEIPWLEGVRYRVRSLKSHFVFEDKLPKNNKVYFILLTESDLDRKIRGLYVGQTFKKIERRFEEHKSGSRQSSGVVRRRGYQVLNSITSLLPAMTKSDSKKFEQLVLRSLRGETKRKTISKLPIKWVRGA